MSTKDRPEDRPNDITIPPDALEAAAFHLPGYHSKDLWPHVEAACLAMLKAWPGMHIHEWQRPWLGGMSGTDIILPLTENTNEVA